MIQHALCLKKIKKHQANIKKFKANRNSISRHFEINKILIAATLYLCGVVFKGEIDRVS